ncbi:MAG: hypothetical protein AMXMBFR47_05030 [Planctomycetota bacterium]
MATLDRYLPPLNENSARWARFAGVIASILVLLWLILGLREVITPILAGWAIAYILNPPVTWLEKNRGIGRITSVTIGLVVLLAVAIILLFAGVVQLIELTTNIPGYVERLRLWMAQIQESTPDPMDWLRGLVTSAPASEPVTRPAADISAQLSNMITRFGTAAAENGFQWISGTLSNVVSWVTFGVLLPMYAFFFLVHFNDIIKTVHDHLPETSRATVVKVASTIDGAIANFFRGRLIVCFCVGGLTSIGWAIVGVDYSLPLGAMAGALTLVPFMSVLSLPPALFFAYMEAMQNGSPWVMPVVLTMGVYMAVQAIESFVLSPIVDGKSSGLHPVTVVVALMVGQHIAGLLGMLLAIPIGSTVKSLAKTYLMPEVRRLAGISDLNPATAMPYDLETSQAQKMPPEEPK